MTRLLIIDSRQAIGLDLAFRATQKGHDVIWAVPPSERNKDIGKGLVERVDDWREYARWADIAFLTDNTMHLRELDVWRRDRGMKVIGATSEAAKWELDRSHGQAILERHGVGTIQHHEFTEYDKAIDFVKKEKRRFVSKPCGDEPDKSLSYVSDSAEDMVYMLERWKKAGKLKGRFILQEFVPGIEMAVGGWFGPGGFNAGWHENFEFKKLMAGDKGPNCFTDDAEVLTKEGWKFWPDVTNNDLFCSLRDGKIVYDPPSQMVSADFDGELVGWQSPTVDILVTPGHQMYVQDDHYRKPFFFEPAHVVYGKRRSVLRAGGMWEGIEGGEYEAMAALTGAYIADGSCRQRSVVFGNCPAHKQPVFIEIARRAGFTAKMYGSDLYINSVALVTAFAPLGRCEDKRVPQAIKDAGPRVIRAFLEGYGAGDGSRRHNNLVYTTVSKGLADDLMELALKIGWAASINTRDRRDEPPHLVNGAPCHNRRIAYDISIARQKVKAELSPDNRYKQAYRGKVYCVTVPSHVIYVRRNGKACWIGQTGEMGTVLTVTRRSKLASKVLAPLEDALAAMDYTGYVDVNCIIDKEGTPWPLEFTMRPGWPTFNIQLALHHGDCVSWLEALSDGRDAKPFDFDKVAIGVVMAISDFPYSHATRKEVTGIPVYNLTPAIMSQVHLCEAMKGEAPQEMGGKIVTAPCIVTAGDYVLVATGISETIRGARYQSSRILDRVKIPNSPFWRPDIGMRLKKQLPELQKHGYATSLLF